MNFLAALALWALFYGLYRGIIWINTRDLPKPQRPQPPRRPSTPDEIHADLKAHRAARLAR